MQRKMFAINHVLMLLSGICYRFALHIRPHPLRRAQGSAQPLSKGEGSYFPLRKLHSSILNLFTRFSLKRTHPNTHSKQNVALQGGLLRKAKQGVSYILLFLPLYSFPQLYPVQLSTQLIPPYSGYISDYADPGNDKLRVILQFNDFTKSQYEIKLSFVIKGNGFTISTPPSPSGALGGGGQPIILLPGVPHLLSGSDLAPYLDSKNLVFSGISQSEYEKRKSLPEGFYTLCVTAYDFFNPQRIQVSNEGCASAWFTLSDPPLLNLPFCKSTVKPSFPQQITFQWTPLNMGSPNSAMNTEYLFELFEIRPAGTDPNLVVQSLPPVFSVVTDLTLLNYGITETPLQEGMEYAWRVQARDKTGRDLFKNKGYSQVCSFLYGNVLPEIKISLNAQASTHRQAKVWWTCSAAFDSFIVQVRKPGYENWFDFPCTGNEQKINDLEPDMTYEARVRALLPSSASGSTSHSSTGEGPAGESPWSNVVRFKTNPLPQYNCNDTYIPMDVLPSGKPLLSAAPGIIVKVGQFEMLTTSIYPSGTPGWYSGFGKMPLIAGINIRVQFKNIFIDDNHTLQSGEVTAISDGVKNWVEQWEYQYDDTYFHKGGIDSILVKGGHIYIITPKGDTVLVPKDYKGGILIQGEDGTQWIVTPDGKIIKVPKGGLLPASTKPLTAEELDILKKAMAIIRKQYNDEKIKSLEKEYDKRNRDALEEYKSQRESIGKQTVELSGSGEVEFIGSGKSNSAASPSTKNYLFKEKETEYNSAKVLYMFSRDAVTDKQYNFIGAYLIVDGKKFSDYVKDELANNKKPEEIAPAVAEKGITALVQTIVKQKMMKD